MSEADKHAKIIWDYMILHHQLTNADLVLVCGNDDEMTCERTLEVYKENLAPLILVSGSGSLKNRDGFQENEAQRIKEYLIVNNIPENIILIEDRARSTGDNAMFSKKLLEEKNIYPKKIILITKPYMERRAYSTFMKQWPGPEYLVTSKQISFEDYCKKFPDKDHFINLMVGDLQRIKEYPKLGFQMEQEIPARVWNSGQELIKLGYDRFLLK